MTSQSDTDADAELDADTDPADTDPAGTDPADTGAEIVDDDKVAWGGPLAHEGPAHNDDDDKVAWGGPDESLPEVDSDDYGEDAVSLDPPEEVAEADGNVAEADENPDESDEPALESPDHPATSSPPSQDVSGTPSASAVHQALSDARHPAYDYGTVTRDSSFPEWDARTSQAVARFQKANGLDVTGELDTATRAQLGL